MEVQVDLLVWLVSLAIIGSMLGRSWSHLREENHVPDAFGSGEHHDKSIDADTDASGWRHAVFEGGKEILIEFLGFAPALVLESLALEVGIIELGVTR